MFSIPSQCQSTRKSNWKAQVKILFFEVNCQEKLFLDGRHEIKDVGS